MSRFSLFSLFILHFSFFIAVPFARAHHAPGTTGGGLSVQSAETLPQGEVSVSYRADYTLYEALGLSEIEALTLSIGAAHVHLDVIRESFLQTLTFAYGALDDLQVEFGILGQYRAVAAAEGHTHGAPDDYGYHFFGDISGQTDTWVNAKWRLGKGDWGSVAVLGGVKFPTGRTDARSQEPPSATNSRILSLGLQPGSGSLDGSLGAAFSTSLAKGLSLDADSRYTFRGSHEDFRSGDRFDGGVAFAYRAYEDPEGRFGVAPILEGNLVVLTRNQEEHAPGEWEEEENTGGTTFFLSPGLRIAVGRGFSAAFTFQLPVVQELNSIQQKTDYKASAVLNGSF